MKWLVIVALTVSCAAAPRPEKQRGMNFACSFSRTAEVRYGSPASEASLRRVKALGANWISIMPFGFERADPSVRLGGFETDEVLAGATKQAHAHGMKVLMKPHVWIRGGDAMMAEWTAEEWRRWFADYETFIVHYATLSRDIGADALSIGNELKYATKHEQEWRAVIAKVRAVYRGPITYGANFDEVFGVKFWDALDFIGVSGYFPLSDAATPDRAALIKAWQPIVKQLGELSRATKKQIVFTEIGYRSADGAAWRQWEIPRTARPNAAAQRIAFEAFFEAVWPQPWVAGAYVWKWFSNRQDHDPSDNDYEVDGKPAEEVIRHSYSTSAARSVSRR